MSQTGLQSIRQFYGNNRKLMNHLRVIRYLGCDPKKTQFCLRDQSSVALDLHKFLLSKNIKVIYYKGGIFEKYLIESLGLFGLDLVDLEKKPFYLPPARAIDLNTDWIKSQNTCSIHKTHIRHSEEHCANIDVLKYYFYVANSENLSAKWPVEIKLNIKAK